MTKSRKQIKHLQTLRVSLMSPGAELRDFAQAGFKSLLAGWEGDRQKDFAEQNELNLKWFQEMASVTEVYITALNVAKAAYTALDIVQ